MNRDKSAQLTIRDLNKLSRDERLELARWLNHVQHEVLELNEIVEPVLIPKYSPVAHWSLMK